MNCIHWWQIDTPDGAPTSPGTCKKCGQSRTFRNSVDIPFDSMFEAAGRVWKGSVSRDREYKELVW